LVEGLAGEGKEAGRGFGGGWIAGSVGRRRLAKSLAGGRIGEVGGWRK